MNNKQKRTNEKNNKKTIIIAIIAALILLAACLVTYLALTSTSRKLTKQLDIAHEYMENGDYEKAIAAFTEAIEIDPTSIEAYLGAAEAYVALDDYESAVEILQKGYDVTGSDEIKAKLDEYAAVIEARKAVEAEQIEVVEDVAEDNDLAYVERVASLDDFKFMGHSVLEKKTVQEIADEYGIPQLTAGTPEPWPKYFWQIIEDEWEGEIIYSPTICCPENDWEADGWRLTYNSGEDLACIHIDEFSGYVDEYYEGPINIGDSIDEVRAYINYDEVMEKGEYKENDIYFAYTVDSPTGKYQIIEDWYEDSEDHSINIEIENLGEIYCLFDYGILTYLDVDADKDIYAQMQTLIK